MDSPADGLEALNADTHRKREQTLCVCGLYDLLAV